MSITVRDELSVSVTAFEVKIMVYYTKLLINNVMQSITISGFAVSVYSDYFDRVCTKILVDQLNKHNFWMYFWNVSTTANIIIFQFY